MQGTAFNWPWPDHVRIVTLPREDTELSISRFGRFLPAIISFSRAAAGDCIRGVIPRGQWNPMMSLIKVTMSQSHFFAHLRV